MLELFAFVNSLNHADSKLMLGDFFNRISAGMRPTSRSCRPPLRRGLSRDLVTLLVSGPVGGTEQVLWTLLLRDQPEHRSPERSRHRCSKR